MKQQLLLIQDVDSLGKKGEIVSAKAGYIRNYLLPKGLAVVASRNELKRQEKLQKEREAQAVIDRKEAEELAVRLQPVTLEIKVKVDPEGRMYGSVSVQDVLDLFAEKGFDLEKKNLLMTKPIKETGKVNLKLRLKESVEASCDLHVIAENQSREEIEAVVRKEEPEEEITE